MPTTHHVICNSSLFEYFDASTSSRQLFQKLRNFYKGFVIQNLSWNFFVTYIFTSSFSVSLHFDVLAPKFLKLLCDVVSLLIT